MIKTLSNRTGIPVLGYKHAPWHTQPVILLPKRRSSRDFGQDPPPRFSGEKSFSSRDRDRDWDRSIDDLVVRFIDLHDLVVQIQDGDHILA